MTDEQKELFAGVLLRELAYLVEPDREIHITIDTRDASDVPLRVTVIEGEHQARVRIPRALYDVMSVEHARNLATQLDLALADAPEAGIDFRWPVEFGPPGD